MFCDLCSNFNDVFVAAVSEPEANEQRQLYNVEKIFIGDLKTLLRNARNCESGKIKGARNCGYARMEKLACAVFYVFSRVEECVWR